MENKHIILVGFILFFCFLPLAAQQTNAAAQETKQADTEKRNYFLKETDKGVTLVQRLSWESLDDIFGF